MKVPLVWRIVAPTLVVSMLLLGVGLGAAWYVYRGSQRVARDLDSQLAGVLAAEGLVLAIRDVRFDLGRYSSADDAEILAQAKRMAAATRQHIEAVRRHGSHGGDETIDELVRNFESLLPQIEALEDPKQEEIESIRAAIGTDTLTHAHSLLELYRKAAAKTSKQNQLIAERVGLSLALLGLCGATAGLLAGFGIARSVNQSIEQLGGTVKEVASTLDFADDAALAPNAELADLVQAMSQVSDKTASVVSELEQSRESALRQDQLAAVGQLAAGIAHELRNPLAAVKLLVETATERERALEGQDLCVVCTEIDRMNHMLQSFLDFARPPRLAQERADVVALLHNAVALVHPRAKRVGVTIEFEAAGPLELSIDRHQIHQVAINLLNNAVEAQPSGGRICIRVERTARRGLPVCGVSIIDEGPGTPVALAERIFKPFVSTKETGVGLGLTICRRILESHGGWIEHAAGTQGGAIFTFFLPLESQPSNPPLELCTSPRSC